MKKITLFLVFIGMMTLQSCEVTEVYDAPIVNTPRTEVFEVTTSFSSSNNFSSLVVFDPPIFNSDSVLIYHLYDVVNGQDVWKLMPQTYYFNDGGSLNYNFDYTKFDAKIYLSANFNLKTLDASWTKNQTFRIVIVPNGYAKTMNKNDINSVLSALNVSKGEIKKIDM